MKRISIIILIFLYGCGEKTIAGISNDFTPTISYSINLDWNNSQDK